MNAYEQLRTALLVEIEKDILGISTETLNKISSALDRAAQRYEVSIKEFALSVDVDPIPELVKIYLVVKKTEGLSAGTIENYSLILQNFFGRVRKNAADVTSNDIRLFLFDYKKYRNVSDRTLDKYRQMICWFFGWAHTEEYIPRNPAKSIKAIKHETKDRQALTQMEMEQLRTGCESVRDRAILELMYSTGCRVSEMATLKKSDINWEAGTVHLFGKGRKHRNSYLNARATLALRTYLKSRSDTCDDLILTERAPYKAVGKEALEAIIRKIGERSGLGRKVTPHIIRHTTATIAVNAGMPIEDVSKFLGHASVNTTMLYAKASNEKVQSEHIRCVI